MSAHDDWFHVEADPALPENAVEFRFPDGRAVRFEITQGIRHHTKKQCDGLACPFHSPSLHPMIEEPMLLRETGLIERTCRHGVGHPDPDSAAWMDRRFDHKPGTWSTHGCDGCCRLPDRDAGV